MIQLVGRMLLSRCQQVAQDALQPRQLGVAAKNGTAAIAVIINALMKKYGHRNDVVVLQIDFENAFNEVNRHVVRRSVNTDFPSLAAFFDAAYGQTAAVDSEQMPRLLCGGKEIHSVNGFHQGMTESPLLFSAMLHDVMNEFDEEPSGVETPGYDDIPPTRALCYLDDVHIFAQHQILVQFVRQFEGKVVRQAGLFLNYKKSSATA